MKRQINLHAVKDFYSTRSTSLAINTCLRCETKLTGYMENKYTFKAHDPWVPRRNFLNICQQIKMKF